MKGFLCDGFVGETSGRSEARTVSGKIHFMLLKLPSDFKSLWQRSEDAEQPLRLGNYLSGLQSLCKKQDAHISKSPPSFERKDARLPCVFTFNGVQRKYAATYSRRRMI